MMLMLTRQRFLTVTIGALTLLAISAPASEDVVLGEPPLAPTDVSSLPRRGPSPRGVTGGFSVNADSREAVRSFYNAVYATSDGVPMNSTANVTTCTPGTNATAFKEAVFRRINWFRAMAGIPAAVTFDASNNVKCQEMAGMMSRNNLIGHKPTPAWTCFTANGAVAATNSNLALGNSGADSITGYVQDFGANNAAVGHRRWLLYPQTQIMGTGDVPRNGSYYPANATWVRDDVHSTDPRPTTRTPYVAWPPAGFAPYPVVFPRWSFAYPNASFTTATISMRSNGVPVAVTKESYAEGYADNTVVWVPMGLNATDSSTRFPFGGPDTVYTVAISNIVGAPQSYYVYTVTVFDPAVPGSDYLPPVVTGPNQPAVGLANAYTFSAVTNATGYEWRAASRAAFSFSDGAETGLGNFTTNTSAGYSIRDANVRASGSYAFRLAHPNVYPNAPPDQVLALNRVMIPGASARLTLKSRLGYATASETARIQVSTNGSGSWHDIFSQSGSGYGTNAPVEGQFVSRSIPLGDYAGLPTELRFTYAYSSTGYGYIAPQSTYPIGWYLDDLVITGAEAWTTTATNATATTTFAFTPPAAGVFDLQVRPLLFAEFPLDWGPVKTVSATTSGTPVITLTKPVLTGGQVRLDFTVAGSPRATFKLLQSDQLGASWVTNATATLTTNTPGNSYRFTTPIGPAARFYRVLAP